MEYPKIKDNDFSKKINKIYKRFKIPKKKKTLRQICLPKGYELQLPQKFSSEFINPSTQYKGILIYHRIGSGKTCTAIRIAEKWKKLRKIIVVVPASLKNNFRNELRSQCAGNTYLKPVERIQLMSLHPTDSLYKEIINKSNERIDKYYEIYSYNKFVEIAQNNKINLRNKLLVIDEIQNMVSEKGTYYETLYNLIHDAPSDLRIVLLSATPMFDKPNEIALTMNLLRIPNEFPVGREFNKMFLEIVKTKTGKYSYMVKNLDLFKNMIKGYISYFRGAPPYTFPILKTSYVKCEMSDFQYSAYKKVLRREEKLMHKYKKKLIKNMDVSDLPNNFFIGTRMVSNIVFPNQKINETGFMTFTSLKIKNNLQKYSTKFYEIMKRVNKAKGKIFIYSAFKEFGGIRSFVKVLKSFGYKDYMDEGSGKKRFAVWSGDEDIKVKEEIKTIFNMSSNLNGHKLKILLGSPSIKEGVSLLAVRQVHIIEPYWNMSRLDQVIGRASRFCSHKDLDEEKRNVKVYIYIAIAPLKYSTETVDEYIKYLASEKNHLIKVFEKTIKEIAIDCELNKNANTYKGEEKIKCE
jgi:superfamily II DNA or RNA helicase